ncbi:hypothetical protein L6258_01790 [Candidatus Parcubacteria bacterium]|nr:hypothetical protein [Candidatus Parcubacteria bacterium]
MEEKSRRAVRILAIAVFLLNVVFWVYPRLGSLGVTDWGGMGPAPSILDEPFVAPTPVAWIFIRNSPHDWHTIELPGELGAPFGGHTFSFRGDEMCRGAEVGARLSVIAGKLPYEVFEIVEVLPEGIWVKPLGKVELRILPPEVPVEPQKSAALGYCPAQSGFLFQERRRPPDSEGTKPIQQLAPKARTKRNRVPPLRFGGVGIYTPLLTPLSRVR